MGNFTVLNRPLNPALTVSTVSVAFFSYILFGLSVEQLRCQPKVSLTCQVALNFSDVACCAALDHNGNYTQKYKKKLSCPHSMKNIYTQIIILMFFCA